MKQLFTILLLLTTVALMAQPTNPYVKWEATAEKTALHTYTLTLTAEIAEHWYVYSQNLENDEGPIATAVTVERPWKAAETSLERGEKVEGYDELFGMNITKYKKRLIIQKTITTKENTTNIKGFITFMSCDDHQCLPPTDVDFEVLLP